MLSLNKPYIDHVIIKDYSDVYDYMLRFKADLINCKRGKNSYSYYTVPMGFDIETTNLAINDAHYGFMYHWQLGFNDMIILGRTYDDLESLISRIITINKLNNHRRVICWVANLSFEFQYIRNHFKVSEVFAKERRQPLKAVLNGCIELRDCLAITGGSLDQLAKDYTTTQKMVGDLDYSIWRSSRTPLSDTERKYCINDVWILLEFALYVFEQYLRPKHYIPLTRTGILRRKIKDTLLDRGIYKDVLAKVKICMPDEQLYHNMMAYLFRGGYVHANAYYVNEILQHMDSLDEKSAYPAVMLQSDHYPTRFDRYNGSVFEIDLSTHTWIAVFEFYNIKAITTHSIESISKCVEIKGNRLIDNGRILRADYIMVFLTDIDFAIYDKYYKWDSMEISYQWVSKTTRLPHYILDNMIDDYELKDQLKRDGKSNTVEYMLCKNRVNSYYGMMVTRLYESNIVYKDNQWMVEGGKSYDDLIKGLFLLPQWGIYVTALARQRILDMTYIFHNRTVYNDTDSIKLLHYTSKCKIKVAMYNIVLYKQMQSLYPDNPMLWTIGRFEHETEDGQYRLFKTLGAKRYIYSIGTKFHATISGLPRASEMLESCGNPYIEFKDDMYISDSKRLVSEYTDKPYAYMVNGVMMQELSGVSLYETPYNMTVKDTYLVLCNIIKKQTERRLI